MSSSQVNPAGPSGNSGGPINGTPIHTSIANPGNTASPNQPTSASGGPSTPPSGDGQWGPAVPPGTAPTFELGADGVYYTNATIDDFSPLITFSGPDGEVEGGEWIRRLTEARGGSPTEPANSQRNWFLGTYKRTNTLDASIKIEFHGSEIHLYGDRGPEYGAYSLTLDGEEPTTESSFFPALAVGLAHPLHSLTGLTEGRHELVITNLGGREGLLEGNGLLLDFAIAKQKVGVPGGAQPQAFDIKGEDLSGLRKNGTWDLGNLQDDVPPGEGGLKIAIYIERKALWTTENFATLTHKFKGTGIQVYGGRNATHGLYRATITDTSSSSIVHSQVYNASTPCDAPDADTPQTNFQASHLCEWRGKALKYSIADLSPNVEYELALQNLHDGESRTVLEVDLVRVIGLEDSRESGAGGALPAGQPPSGPSGATSAASGIYAVGGLPNLKRPVTEKSSQ